MPLDQSKPRTTQIPVQLSSQDLLASSTDTSPVASDKQNTSDNFVLNVSPAHDAGSTVQAVKTAQTNLNPKPQSSQKPPSNITAALQKKFLKTQQAVSSRQNNLPLPKMKNKIWRWMEWFATSAAIFIVLFFVMNWNSYSMLFKAKLDQIKGGVQNASYIKELNNDTRPSAQDQKPLPIVTNPETAKKQVPELSLSIAPPDDRIIIPGVNQSVPIIKVSTEKLIQRDWGALEAEIQEALRSGVVHYPGTAQPNERGNVVVTGHSSYFPWDPGRFKDVFAVLHQVKVGDKVIVYHDQKKYTYEIYEKEVVTPDKIEVLTRTGPDRLTLITCTPVGTNLKRLIVLAKPIES